MNIREAFGDLLFASLGLALGALITLLFWFGFRLIGALAVLTGLSWLFYRAALRLRTGAGASEIGTLALRDTLDRITQPFSRWARWSAVVGMIGMLYVLITTQLGDGRPFQW